MPDERFEFEDKQCCCGCSTGSVARCISFRPTDGPTPAEHVLKALNITMAYTSLRGGYVVTHIQRPSFFTGVGSVDHCNQRNTLRLTSPGVENTRAYHERIYDMSAAATAPNTFPRDVISTDSMERSRDDGWMSRIGTGS